MPEERHSMIANYGQLLLVIIVAVGGAYVSDRIQATRVEERLLKLEQRDSKLTDITIANMIELAENRGRTRCEREQE